MTNIKSEYNDVNGAGATGEGSSSVRCSTDQQLRSRRLLLLLKHHDESGIGGPFRSTEQRIADQARAIRKNGWLIEMELKEIKRRVLSKDNVIDEVEQALEVDNGDAQMQDDSESSSEIDSNAQPSDSKISEPENNGQNNPDVSEDELEILFRIKEIMDGGEFKTITTLKRINRMRQNMKTQKVNKAIKYFETTNVTDK